MKKVRIVVMKKDGICYAEDSVHEASDPKSFAAELSEVLQVGYETGHVVLTTRGVVRAIPWHNIDEFFIEEA